MLSLLTVGGKAECVPIPEELTHEINVTDDSDLDGLKSTDDVCLTKGCVRSGKLNPAYPEL